MPHERKEILCNIVFHSISWFKDPYIICRTWRTDNHKCEPHAKVAFGKYIMWCISMTTSIVDHLLGRHYDHMWAIYSTNSNFKISQNRSSCNLSCWMLCIGSLSLMLSFSKLNKHFNTLLSFMWIVHVEQTNWFYKLWKMTRALQQSTRTMSKTQLM